MHWSFFSTTVTDTTVSNGCFIDKSWLVWFPKNLLPDGQWLAPQFLIFDEYVAFLEMLTTKESTALLSQLEKIVMLGRQAGYFLIVACQRPDAKYFGDGIGDNFNFRVGLGRMSKLSYGMLFGSDVKKQFFQKRIKGRGYCDVGTSVISEFYTPLIPKGYDFLGTIGELAKRRTEKKGLGQSEALL